MGEDGLVVIKIIDNGFTFLQPCFNIKGAAVKAALLAGKTLAGLGGSFYLLFSYSLKGRLLQLDI